MRGPGCPAQYRLSTLANGQLEIPIVSGYMDVYVK